MPKVRVECYAGYKANERPSRLWLPDRCLEVQAVEDRWYSPGVTFFRVRVAGGDRYLLRYCEAQESWELEGFRAADGKSGTGKVRPGQNSLPSGISLPIMPDCAHATEAETETSQETQAPTAEA